MDVYINNLPGGSYDENLSKILFTFDKKAILKHVRKDNLHKSHHYYIAKFNSDRAARKFINIYTVNKLDGYKVFTREYYHRCLSNDRRNVKWREKSWGNTERRVAERRVYEESHR